MGVRVPTMQTQRKGGGERREKVSKQERESKQTGRKKRGPSRGTDARAKRREAKLDVTDGSL